MRVHVWPLNCDVCGGEGMGTADTNRAAWSAYGTVVHSNPEVCRVVIEDERRRTAARIAELESRMAEQEPTGGER
jgi:hypothetical protein